MDFGDGKEQDMDKSQVLTSSMTVTRNWEFKDL